MKFLEFINEEEAKILSPLKNPSLMFATKQQAFYAAQKQSQNFSDINNRAYIMSYKYAKVKGLKRYIVINNKTLMSQAPDYKNKGYTIIGWWSPLTGPVSRTRNGKYVKGQMG
jgi:hypothetical protein